MSLVATVLAMQDAGYVAAGWLLTLAAVGAYALHVLQRGRQLSRQVPPEERRWS
jgi:hypothetical protein